MKAFLLRYGLVMLLIVAAVLSGLLSKTYRPGEYRDDVCYVAAARAMAQGKGYLQLYSATPAVEVTYPPGYSLLLVPAQCVAPENFVLLRGLTLLCSMAALALLWRSDPRIGPAAAVLTVGNTYWHHSSTTLMSDIPFALVLAGWLLVLPPTDGQSVLSRNRRLALSLTIAFGIYLRSVGIGLLPVTVVALRFRGVRLLDIAAVSLYSVLFSLPGLLLSRMAGYRSAVNDYRDIEEVALDNFTYYLKMLPPTLWGEPYLWLVSPPGWLFLVSLVIFTVAGCRGAIALVRERKVEVPGLLLLFSLVYLVWPFQAPRFWLPLLPLVYLIILRGMGSLTEKRVGRRSLLPLMLPLLLLQAGVLYKTLVQPAPESTPDYEIWLKENTGADEIVASDELSIWLHTGRQVLPVLAGPSPEIWVHTLHFFDTRWLVVGDYPANASILRLATALPEHFRPAYSNPEERILIFELVGDSRENLRAFAWVDTGRRRFLAGDAKGAVKALINAVLLEPWYVGPRVLLAEALWAAGQREAAEHEIEHILRIEPGNQGALRMRERLSLPAPEVYR